MNYADARNQIKSGDLLAWRSLGSNLGSSSLGLNRLIPWLISRVTGGAHTHVGVAWWFHDRLFVLEAKERVGVQLRALSNTGNFDWIPTNIQWELDVEKFALAKLGKHYSYIEAVASGLGFKVTNDGYICSEYAAELFRQSGVFDERISGSPTPTRLVQFWLDQGAPLRAISG